MINKPARRDLVRVEPGAAHDRKPMSSTMPRYATHEAMCNIQIHNEFLSSRKVLIRSEQRNIRMTMEPMATHPNPTSKGCLRKSCRSPESGTN
jgi:hypothetical protein